MGELAKCPSSSSLGESPLVGDDRRGGYEEGLVESSRHLNTGQMVHECDESRSLLPQHIR